ncbi:hypothetical protein LWI29_004208 [Acer saccharum]|nr:hypothetical protein LWI29_004208 [Acer saccharum]
MDPHIDLNQELSDCGNNNGCGEEHVDCENNDGGGEEHIDSGNNDGGSLIEEQKFLEPCNGMEFESDANAYSYYLQYAKQMGFGASKTQCRRSKVTMEWIEAKYACTREGTKRKTNALNPRPCLKSNCQALLHVKRREDGKWFVHNFVKEHNHELSPANAHYFPCHRRIAAGVKHNITSLHAVGVKTSKIFAALAKKYKGYENIGFMEKDMRNLFDKERRLALEPGDANAMLELFTSMQEVDPNFFYAMKLDEEHRLKNVFWEDFEQKWHNMVESFELHGEDWIRDLFRDRKYWAPTYMRDTFFAGMSTTSRSESINSFFDKYVNKTTSLKEFVEQYKVAAEDRAEVEKHADFNLHKKPTLRSPSPFEKQMSKIYTFDILKKFQIEVTGVTGCHPVKENDEDMNMTYRVHDFEKKEDFAVVFERRNETVSCLCKLFEYNGFLCRHAMSVLQSCGVFQIPKHYILKRWSKDAKDGHTTTLVLKETDPKKQRFEDLFEKANKLVEEGSVSDQSYKVANRALEEALKKCTSMNHSLTGVKEPNCASHKFHNVDKENVNSNMLSNVLDPKGVVLFLLLGSCPLFVVSCLSILLLGLVGLGFGVDVALVPSLWSGVGLVPVVARCLCVGC